MKNIVIIGGGLGGLTSGALLSQKGYNVTLLEQHNIVGGAATTFKRKGGFSIEVGLHEMDNVFEDLEKNKIFKTLGVYDNIDFVSTKEFFSVKLKNEEFVMPNNIKDAIESLNNRFPNEKKGIEKYFDISRDIYEEYVRIHDMKWYEKLTFPISYKNIWKYKNVTLKEVLDDLFKDETLKLILSANNGFYNDSIETFNFLVHARAQYSYYKGGAWFIKGGSQKLSNYLASIIEKNGGKVIKKADVTKISMKNKKVKGVFYNLKNKEYFVSADDLISNTSPENTYKMLGMNYEETKKEGMSLCTLYLGFNKNLKDVYGEKPYMQVNMMNVKNIKEYEEEHNVNEKIYEFIDYSQLDSGLTKSKEKSVAVITLKDDIEDWDNLSKEEYELKKEEVKEILISNLEKDYPNIRDYIEYSELATAKTVKRYLKTKTGTAYGYSATNENMSLKPQIKSNKVKNLYFAGAYTISSGFTPAILSGGMVSKCFK